MSDQSIVERKLEVGVKVLLYVEPGKFLFLKRAKPYPGNTIRKWDVPGGRINVGEELLTALKREVMEETGLKLKKVDRVVAAQDILRVPTKHTIRITYIAQCQDQKIKLDPNEHGEYQWLTIKEAKRLRMDSYLKPVIDQLT